MKFWPNPGSLCVGVCFDILMLMTRMRLMNLQFKTITHDSIEQHLPWRWDSNPQRSNPLADHLPHGLMANFHQSPWPGLAASASLDHWQSTASDPCRSLAFPDVFTSYWGGFIFLEPTAGCLSFTKWNKKQLCWLSTTAQSLTDAKSEDDSKANTSTSEINPNATVCTIAFFATWHSCSAWLSV